MIKPSQKKKSVPKEVMQTSHCRSCNYNTCQSIFWGWPRKLPRFSKPWFQGIGHFKPTHSLLLSRISSSAPLRFVWLKINPIKLPLDERTRWALCTRTRVSREQGGSHTEPRGWRTTQARLASACFCLKLLLFPGLRCGITMGRMM